METITTYELPLSVAFLLITAGLYFLAKSYREYKQAKYLSGMIGKTNGKK